MSSNPFNRNLANITDTSDWQKTKLPNLSELDSLKRCYICKEFFKAPVITSCNHTFCSQCIREYLIGNNLCPLCKTELFESNLRRDILLDEIVACYTRLRPHLIGLLQLETEQPAPADTSNHQEHHNHQDETIHAVQKRPRDDDEDVVEISSHDIQRTRPDLVKCPVCSELMTADTLQMTHIDDCLSGRKPRKKRLTPPLLSGIASFFKKIDKPPPQKTLPDLGGHQQLYETARSNDTKKLSKLDFLSLTTPKLKEKLATLRLPVQGTRVQLELRYNQYYVLYNSNLDSNRPISDKLLKQKLNQWELSHLAFTNTSASTLFSSHSALSNKSITDKNFLPKAWILAYQQEFKDLIKQARLSAKKQPVVENEVAPVSEAAADAPAADSAGGATGTRAESPAEAPGSSRVALPETATGPPGEDFDLDLSESPLFAAGQTPLV